jgi:hypothetical protein
MKTLPAPGGEMGGGGDTRDRLEAETGWPVVLEYPLDGGDLRVLRLAETGPEELDGGQRAALLQRLWEITLQRVDETML